MFRVLAFVILALSLSADLSAQRFTDARSYYREFASENRRIMIKNMRYLEGVVKGEDPRRIAKYREMVVEQLRESKRALERVGVFEDNDLLQREYLKGIDMYLEAFEKAVGEADELTEGRYEDFDKLTQYYEAVEEAEALIFDAAYKIKEAEEYFAKQYKVDLRRDEETMERWDKIDRLTLYMRGLTYNFFRVDTRLSSFFKATEAQKADTLGIIIKDLRQAVRKSQDELEDQPEFGGKDYVKEELEAYLTEIDENIDETIRPLADRLTNKFLPEDEYEETQEELADLKEWHENARQEFFESQEYVVADFLEE